MTKIFAILLYVLVFEASGASIIAAGGEITRSDPALNLNTNFFIGSLSKQFTAVLVLLYLPDKLDAEITTFIQDERFRGITLRSLLNHTSGLNDKPGYCYQNENYDLAGKILEIATGRKYAVLVCELVNEAGMSNTFCESEVSEVELFTRLKKSLVPLGLDPTNLKNILRREADPSSGIVSTASDLLRWSEFLVKRNLYKKLTESNVEMEDGSRYGFGIIICGDIFLHNGAIANEIDKYCQICTLAYNRKTGKSVVGFEVFKFDDQALIDKKLIAQQTRCVCKIEAPH
jgi:CubicO group peptidase (beta-lactamase class C family)